MYVAAQALYVTTGEYANPSIRCGATVSVILPVMPDVLDIVVLGALPPVGANKNPWKIKRFQTFAFPKLLVPFFMYVTTLMTR